MRAPRGVAGAQKFSRRGAVELRRVIERREQGAHNNFAHVGVNRGGEARRKHGKHQDPRAQRVGRAEERCAGGEL